MEQRYNPMNVKPSAPRAPAAKEAPIAGEIFLRALADHGVDFFFANPGTDFPPIVEAYSRAREGSNSKVPRPVLVPHENLAVAMAHGAYLMTGRAQAVMVHVNVGTANTINNLTNMSRDRIPLFLAAGRTPVTETGNFGSRDRSIHWAQEMFDQAGMVRELVKWDYELRVPEQVGNVVARAYEAAMTSPMGPVYLILPREPLSATVVEPTAPSGPRAIPAPPHPDPKSIETLAAWIAAAEKPLIVTANCGPRSARGRIARAARRALGDPGGAARAALPVPADQPPDALRLQSGRGHRRGRSRHRARIRRAVDSERRCPEGFLQGRACRRRPDVPALPDAQLPQRPRHHLDAGGGARRARCGAGARRARQGEDRGAARTHP